MFGTCGIDLIVCVFWGEVCVFLICYDLGCLFCVLIQIVVAYVEVYVSCDLLFMMFTFWFC